MKYQMDPSTGSGQLDYFEHRYEYDGNNNLKWASTTRDGLTWDDDAKLNDGTVLFLSAYFFSFTFSHEKHS